MHRARSLFRALFLPVLTGWVAALAPACVAEVTLDLDALQEEAAPTAIGQSDEDALAQASVEELTLRLVQLAERLEGADDATRIDLLGEAMDVAALRRELLVPIARESPLSFLRLVLPAEVREAFPAEIQSDLEEETDVIGPLQTLCALDVGAPGAGGRERCFVTIDTDSGVLELRFADGATLDLTGFVTLHGVRLADVIVLESLEQVLSLVGVVANASTGGQSTLGPQRILAILYNFLDDTSEPVTRQAFHDNIFTASNSFYVENSYGQTTIVGETHGWFTLPVNKGALNVFQQAEAAKTAARNAGIAVDTFTRFIFYHTSGANTAGQFSGGSGLGTVGGNPSTSWITGRIDTRVTAHEIGHNFSLHHANALECAPGVVAGTGCSVAEYGDFMDTMGIGQGAPHFNAFQKERVFFLGTPSSPAITTVSQSGSFTFEAMSLPMGPTPKALKILRSVHPTTGERIHFYVERRTRSGLDASVQVPGGSNAYDGVLVHLGSSTNNNSSHFLDMNPTASSTALFNGDLADAALAVGQTFTDPATGLAITLTATTATTATVQVTLPGSNGDACVAAAPEVVLSPATQSTTAGSTVSYAVSVRNRDSAACVASAFNLAAAFPQALVGNLSTTALSLAPGAQGSATLTVQAPAGAVTATHALAVTASRTSGAAATGQATLAVTATPVATCVRGAPQVAFAPVSQAAVAGTTLSYTVTLTNTDTAECAAQALAVSALLPTGFTSNLTGSAQSSALAPGAQASFVLAVTSGATVAAGNHTISVRATSSVDATRVGTGSGIYTVNAPACVRAAPSITISPASQFGSAGQTLAYSVRVTNNDGAGCTAAAFPLAATLPTGFTGGLSAQALTLAPGTAANATLTATSPATAPAQLFTLVATATHPIDAALRATAQASYGVSAVLNLAVGTDKSTYRAREVVHITTTVARSGTVAAGVPVTLRITQPGGRVVTATATTDGSGVALVGVNLGSRPRTGTWSVRAEATSNGATGSATTAFNVVR